MSDHIKGARPTNIAGLSIDTPVNTWLVVLICLFGGLWGFLTVGRLEDPSFTIKMAQVYTSYPGATAEEVEREVTERLESAIQQMAQLKTLTSASHPGRSQITVEIQDTYDSEELPQVWDELRRKVRDTVPDLPPGTRAPQVNDDYGDVFGLFYALTAPGYSDGEIRDIAKDIRRDLLTVDGVAKVAIDGDKDETVVIEIPQDRLASLGLSLRDLAQLLDVEHAIQPTGSVRVGDRRLAVPVDDAFDRVEAIRRVKIGVPGSTAMLALDDIADVSVQPDETPAQLIRFNGQPAVTLGVSAVPGTNIVDVGAGVAAKLDAIRADWPLGVDLAPIYDQARVVEQSVDGFVASLGLSVAIVIGVLMLFMGWRAGLVVGSVLFLTVAGTLLLMKLAAIDMQRISLGALIIAMGMLVDNAIVIAEGMMVSMQRGLKARAAAVQVVRQTQWPLLGATIIGIMAFSGIGLSPDATGEFLFSLFAVIAMSLLLSWGLAVTVIPLFGSYLLKQGGADDADPYGNRVYRGYGRVLRLALRHRLIAVSLLVATTGGCFWGFGQVAQAFFPASNTPLFYVHYWMPQGTDVRAVSRDLAQAEPEFLAMDEVVEITSFAGRGAQRFMLTYSPQNANGAYGHMIVRTQTREQIPAVAETLRDRLLARNPEALVYTERLVFGPSADSDIAARFSGPDPEVLRDLAEQAAAVLGPHADIVNVRHDWRQRELTVVPVMSDRRTELAAVDRAALSDTIKFATDGLAAGFYRDGDESLEILLRAPLAERGDLGDLGDRLVWSEQERSYVPASQIVETFRTEARDTEIHRRDRVRTLTVMAKVGEGPTVDSVFRQVRADVEAIDLPRGYSLEWGGIYEDTNEAQASLGAQLPLGFLIMLLITVLLFGTVREPLIIWLTVPMAVCGVTLALLGTGMPFGFMALLGMLSLSGMLIKNAIVLVEEVDLQIGAGRQRFEAILDAGISRLRPVALAAVTTILGMVPLLFDAFFASMAVTIMGGLAFATVLTLVAVPVLYALLYRVREDEPAPRMRPDAGPDAASEAVTGAGRAEPSAAGQA
ncbi:multidrug efflux pump subunit AcrB [Rhodothalassium salexigens DSM 2132]|uniref:Multidrug efflux pump subunit AcrB n=1 Tax=Rhodothalassium salexigens DSM 2132 TaxID=1188247 RepID=A0A4V6NQP6_RHOSA|nr:efflux RND transporter permease subunit [Rhodothalassium salexigens]MBB4212731.1 multidrug efflux pump subunit AcrB [Rhodothalassium salexigens DSM 2132]MBK1639234.1 MFS transporter [Rhodothalassium salexigens DSM 2132]TCP30166.1 multidrug efflux pump subunit AcrB [Rhodothalassium salexigens DSM 2132]